MLCLKFVMKNIVSHSSIYCSMIVRMTVRFYKGHKWILFLRAISWIYNQHVMLMVFQPIWYHILGDVLFLLKSWLLRSFSGPLTEKQRIFAYGSQNLENVFGTMIDRWPIFLKPFKNSAENVVNTYLLAYHYIIVSARVMMSCTAQQGFWQLDNTTRWVREGYWGHK